MFGFDGHILTWHRLFLTNFDFFLSIIIPLLLHIHLSIITGWTEVISGHGFTDT